MRLGALIELMAAALVALLPAACGTGDRASPTPYGDLVERRAPSPRGAQIGGVDASEPNAPPAAAFPSPSGVEPPAGPDLPPGAPPLGAPEPVPPAWPRTRAPIAATAFSRRVVFGERVVGVVPEPGGAALAVEATGGVFRAEPIGGWSPLSTPLPPRVTRVIALEGGDVAVACTPGVPHARLTQDGGRSWSRLGFNCGPEGERTLADAGGRIYALLPDGMLRIGGLSEDGATRRALPLDAPRALGALDRTVVVFGERGVIYSHDFGETFHVGRRPVPRALRVVRDVVFVGKAVVVAIGEAEPGGASVLVSRDGGATFAAPDRLPRRADDLAAVAVGPDGRVVAVPRAAGEALESRDAARTWQPLAGDLLFDGAVASAGPGFLAGAPRGLVLGIDRAAPPTLGVERPLWDAVFTHPRVAVGAGLDGGLYHSRDGGRTWARVPGTAPVRIWGLASPGGHIVVAVGDGVLWRGDAAAPRRFEHVFPPMSCRARWVRFRPGTELGLVGCAGGAILRSDDSGHSWTVAAELERAVGPAIWMPGPVVGALGAGGRVVYSSDDDGLTWAPASTIDAVDVVRLDVGPTVLTASGGLLAAPDLAGPWTPVPGSVVADAREVLTVADGRRLVLAGDLLYALRPGAPPRELAAVPGARRVVPVGDGGLLVLQSGATTRLEPR